MHGVFLPCNIRKHTVLVASSQLNSAESAICPVWSIEISEDLKRRVVVAKKNTGHGYERISKALDLHLSTQADILEMEEIQQPLFFPKSRSMLSNPQSEKEF